MWSFYSLRLRVLVEAEPNAGHLALAELERAGHVSAVVTQNIDGLHQRAGSRDVTEVHGSIRSSTCLQCGASYSLAELLGLLEGAEAPACTRVRRDREAGRRDVRRADARGGDRPGLRARALDRACCSSSDRRWRSGRCRSSRTRRASAGGAVAIVNKGPTSYDGRAAVKCDGAAGETLTALVGELS